jgi:Cu2+-exporting ATPase
LAQTLDVFRLGKERVRIRGAQPQAPETHELLKWLEARTDVTNVAYRERVEAIEVQYREAPRQSGAFVRSLSDRVHTLSTPAGTATMTSEVSHALKGRVRLRLNGVSADDVVRIAGWIADAPGVLRASSSPASQSVLVLFDPKVTTAEAIAEAVAATDPTLWPKAPEAPKKNGWAATAGTALVLGAALSGAVPAPVMMAGVALTALPSAKRALVAASERRVSVDVLDVAAVGISIATGQLATAAFITLLLSVGDRILERTADSARGAISKLMRLDASEAWRIEGERVVRVAASKLEVGDRVVIEPGGRVAADGIVVSGEASVDEKALTGESMPRTKRAGDRVLAATVVLEGQIVLEVERVGGDTTAAKIVRILEGAGAKPMTLQRETERVTDQLVLPTMGVAAGAAVVTGQLARATSVLITDFGTGVRIAVPTSTLTAMTLAARSGVLVKGAQYLERLSKTDAIVFDKTGTLTCGQPVVVDVTTVGSLSIEQIVFLSASAEARQSHPIAEALRAHALKLGLSITEPELGSETVAVGYGLSARVEGHDVLVGGGRWMRRHEIDVELVAPVLERHRALSASSIVVAVDGAIAGVVAYADAPRKESAEVIKALRANGRRKIFLLSGDARASVDAVAKAVGADVAVAEMLPEEKSAYVQKLQAEGHTVAMVGDGINDAPALAQADVGIAMGSGTDVARESADVVLLGNDLLKLVEALRIARRCRGIIRQNFAGTLLVDGLGIVLAGFGFLNPLLAAFIHVSSELLFILNSTRLLPARAR